MNSLIAVILTTFSFITAGWYLTYLMPSIGRIERMGLAFLLGAGGTTYLWFHLYQLGLPLTLPSYSLAVLVLAGVGFGLSRALHLEIQAEKSISFTKNQKYLALLVTGLLLAAFTIGSYTPLTAWDSIALYDFRGHAIAISHSLNDFTWLSYYISYPFMISLVHALVYLLGGVSAQGIHAVIFSAFIAIVYGRLKAWSNVTYALLGCLLIALQSEIFGHATFAYTNLPYTGYLVAGFLYAVSIGGYSLVIGGLLFGLSTWVRSAEVFWIAGSLLLLYEGWRTKRLSTAVIALLSVLLIRYGWTSYANGILATLNQPSESVTSHISVGAVPIIISKLSVIAHYIYTNIVLPYVAIWFLAVSVALSLIKTRSQLLFGLLGTLMVSAGMVVFGVMIFSTYYETWDQIGDSAKRMILFIIPLTILIGVYGLYETNKKNKYDK